MPRYPNKRRCQKPGCRNWAMRTQVYGRSHLDHVFGPRGAGAPFGNMSAWKHHKRVAPEAHKLICKIAYRPYEQPEILQPQIARLVDYFYNHGASQEGPRTLKAIAALKVVLELLEEAHAQVYFLAELREILSHLPPEHRPAAQSRLWQAALQHSPLNRVAQIRKAKPDFIARHTRTLQLPVHPPTSDDSR